MKPLNLLSALAIASVLTAGGLTNSSPAAAQSIKCGKAYKIVRGDSLSEIAQRAYRGSASFQLLYSVNSGTIGPNPSLIQEGAILKIPCLDKVAPSTASTTAIRQVSTTEALPPPAPRQIRFVVGTDWAPFTNEDQAQGGGDEELVAGHHDAASGSSAAWTMTSRSAASSEPTLRPMRM